jgi:hypothetical protein
MRRETADASTHHLIRACLGIFPDRRRSWSDAREDSRVPGIIAMWLMWEWRHRAAPDGTSVAARTLHARCKA